ncbi:MAG TPA: MBL fold metallo-hydrolase [Bryobacteraceae bacterium]|jgi:phosphoribosyl 1,2-cyclic phosphate phosphodiesterase|nr:MBL fold metallo-hydrolase [Bryobacteraceae bacterium]
MPLVRITVLGSGTSVGVPMIGCTCDVCKSTDPRDKRLRPSIVLRYDGRVVLIDTTPDLRAQSLRYGLQRLDAVLFTHAHADHIMGLDDIRPFNFLQRENVPLYADEATLASIKRVFNYIFELKNPQSSIPRVSTVMLNGEAFDLFGLKFTPVPLLHGNERIYGFRFGDSAYLTDHSDIPDESVEMLQNLDVLFLDALRHKPHPTHSTVEQSLQTVERLRPRRAYFTHISHDLGHEKTERLLPSNVKLAYDGLDLHTGALSN